MFSIIKDYLASYFLPEENNPNKDKILIEDPPNNDINKKIYILYGSNTGSTEKSSNRLHQKCHLHQFDSEIIALNKMEPEDFIKMFLTFQPDIQNYFIFLLPTSQEGMPPDNARHFCQFIHEHSRDFRVGTAYLKGVNVAVFGFGNKTYESTYNHAAKVLHHDLRMLGSNFIIKLGLADENSIFGFEPAFDEWCAQLFEKIKRGFNKKFPIIGELDAGFVSDDEGPSGLDLDIEDLEKYQNEESSHKITDMVTPLIRKSLTKQGYKIIGSHSGVKICRWTKAMIRDRGGCYKHTFYGISSHCCMEATPSLACANKCVFCWRHHTNPVGTHWKWNTDSPSFIVDEMVKNHLNMANQLKGIPGANPIRIKEARVVRHCALSLVGEPIMYPHINELVDLMHERRISTFLVTNAQFPEQIKNLPPLTQLYVSVDAATKSSLKKIDQPIFEDYWERFLQSIDYLSEKKQRTVFRLTLVRGWNLSDIEEYSKLIKRGKPSFIEIKAVTFCGKNNDDHLRITNVPYHQEVILFSESLLEHLSDYDISCEHEHSNCVLLAHKKFYFNDKWHTWIDYDKFQEMYKVWKLTHAGVVFNDLDYSIETPDWAIFGSPEKGFDPSDTRFRREKK